MTYASPWRQLARTPDPMHGGNELNQKAPASDKKGSQGFDAARVALGLARWGWARPVSGLHVMFMR
jgi:hypothetical protein